MEAFLVCFFFYFGRQGPQFLYLRWMWLHSWLRTYDQPAEGAPLHGLQSRCNILSYFLVYHIVKITLQSNQSRKSDAVGVDLNLKLKATLEQAEDPKTELDESDTECRDKTGSRKQQHSGNACLNLIIYMRYKATLSLSLYSRTHSLSHWYPSVTSMCARIGTYSTRRLSCLGVHPAWTRLSPTPWL